MKKKKNNLFNVYCIADIHFGKKSDKKLYNDLKEYFIDNINQLIKDNDHIDMLLILGDLFDRVIKMSESSAKYVIDLINELCQISNENNFYFRIIKGTKNHDFNQLNNFSKLEIEYPLFKIINTKSTEIISTNEYDYRILYLPEEYPDDYDKYYSDVIGKNIDDNYYDFIFGHGMIDFVSYTGNEEEIKMLNRSESVHKAKELDRICNVATVFGHIHDFMQYKDKEKIFYVGSFERFSFAHQEDKGTLFISYNPETDDKEVEFFLNENASTYYVCDFNEIEEDMTVQEQLKYIAKLQEEYDYVKVKYPNNDKTGELIKKLSSDDKIIMEVKNEIKEDIVDERFNFIIKKELDLPNTIQKYISLTKNKDIDLTNIKKFLVKQDIDD